MATEKKTVLCWACQRRFPLDALRSDLRCTECDDADCDEQRCDHRSAEVADAARADLWDRFTPFNEDLNQ